MSGVLIAHRGAVKVPKEKLYEIPAPAPTKSWQPVGHGALVDTLTKVLHSKGLSVKKEEYAVQREGNLLFGVMDLMWQDEEKNAALGLRTSNDKSFAIQIAIGARVIVCDNLLLSGELIALKRKHTSGLDLWDECRKGIDKYIHGFGQLNTRIEQMQQLTMSVTEARELVFNVFAQKIVPLRLFPHVAHALSREVAKRNTPTQWILHNCFTEYLKALPAGVAFQSNIKLGKFFHLN